MRPGPAVPDSLTFPMPEDTSESSHHLYSHVEEIQKTEISKRRYSSFSIATVCPRNKNWGNKIKIVHFTFDSKMHYFYMEPTGVLLPVSIPA